MIEASGTYTFDKNLTVFRMGFGALRITGDQGWGLPKDKNNSLAVLKKCMDLGINFIDTADSYGPHVSEELIVEVLHPYSKELLIATKGGFLRPSPSEWVVNGRPEHLEHALKGSLKRLKVDRIDLYQLHRFDPDVPMDETLGILKELQDQEYIRHLGLSEVNVEQLEKASQIIDVKSVQNRYSLTYRKSENVLRWCEQNDAAFIPWYPLDAGALENKHLQDIANQHGVSIYQIALAWLLQYSPNILPIPGTSSVSHLHENVAASGIKLSEQEMEILEGKET